MSAVKRYRICELQHPSDLATIEAVFKNAECVLASYYDAVVAENARLRKVLSWYADISNYGTRVCNDGDDHFDVIESDAEEDRGERASAALAKE